jgi:folate-binding protein YgfZ
MTGQSMPALEARLVPRDVLEVSGADAVSYLQGQCSQDVAGLAEGASAEALLLSPQGKVDAWVRCTRTGPEAFVLDTEAGQGPAVVARLERFRLRTKVEIRPMVWRCLALRGSVDVAALPVPPGSPGGPAVVAALSWPGRSGLDLLGPAPDGDSELTGWLPAGAVLVGAEAWEAARIAAGIPAVGAEVTGATIPAEVGLVERTVSFTKGCYTGQELVARLDARGSKVARRLCGLVVEGAEVPPVGAAVWTADGDHEVGPVTSSAWSAGRSGPVALAVLHRRVEPPTPVVIRWSAADGAACQAVAEARPLPLAP